MNRLIIIVLFITPIVIQGQNNGIGINITASREKIKTGFNLEKEIPNKYRLGITLNYGSSKQDYPTDNSLSSSDMFELPYMDDQEHLYASYINSNSIIHAFVTELDYTQLIGGRPPNSTSVFGLYIRLGYGYLWDKYDALYDSYKYGEFYVKDTYKYNFFNGAAGINYRWTKHRNFVQVEIGPNFYYPLKKYSESDFTYSRHAPFVSTEYELKIYVGRKF
jgi:hypothetical protein